MKRTEKDREESIKMFSRVMRCSEEHSREVDRKYGDLYYELACKYEKEKEE